MEKNNSTNQQLGQQNNNQDYLMMMKFLARVREKVKDLSGKSDERVSDEQILAIVKAGIQKGTLIGKPNPMNEIANESSTDELSNSVLGYIKACQQRDPKTGLKPRYSPDGFVEYCQVASELNDDKKLKGEDAKKAAQQEIIAQKTTEVKGDPKDKPKEYYEAVLEILGNKERGAAVDQTAYWFACEQLIFGAERVSYIIADTEQDKTISFVVKFPGLPEKAFKTLDFRQQREEIRNTPMSVQDLEQLNGIADYPPAKRKDVLRNIVAEQAKKGAKGKDSKDKPAPAPRNAKEQAAFDRQFDNLNENPDARFEDIKKRLGFKKGNDYKLIEVTNNRDVLAAVVNSFREMPGVTKQIDLGRSNEQ